MSTWTLQVLVLFAALAGAASAQQATPPADGEAEARATLERMAALIAGTQELSVSIESSYDVVQRDGQRIEFGESRRVAVRRPDRFRADTEERDGSRRGFLFDGKEIAAFDLDQNVYASVPKSGTADQALDYSVNELGMRIPLVELFSSDLLQTVERSVSVRFVAEERIAGVPCDHLAVRADEADYEIWIATGERPLPQRIVVTYRQALGQPQFAANFSSWNLAADLPDALFAYQPAEGAERVRVTPPAEGTPR